MEEVQQREDFWLEDGGQRSGEGEGDAQIKGLRGS